MTKFLYRFYTDCWPLTYPMTVGLIAGGVLYTRGFYHEAAIAVDLGPMVGCVFAIVYLVWPTRS